MKRLMAALRRLMGLAGPEPAAPLVAVQSLPEDVPILVNQPRPAERVLYEVDFARTGGPVRGPTSIICPSCRREVHAWREYANGRLECIGCPGPMKRRR